MATTPEPPETPASPVQAAARLVVAAARRAMPGRDIGLFVAGGLFGYLFVVLGFFLGQ